jgi:transposase-like protein
MPRLTRYSPELKERAVKMVVEHRVDYSSERAAINRVASMLG